MAIKEQTFSEIQWQNVSKKPLLKSDQTDLACDWIMTFREGCDRKYNRLMYSPTLDQFRQLTYGEFYGSSGYEI